MLAGVVTGIVSTVLATAQPGFIPLELQQGENASEWHLAHVPDPAGASISDYQLLIDLPDQPAGFTVRLKRGDAVLRTWQIQPGRETQRPLLLPINTFFALTSNNLSLTVSASQALPARPAAVMVPKGTPFFQRARNRPGPVIGFSSHEAKFLHRLKDPAPSLRYWSLALLAVPFVYVAAMKLKFARRRHKGRHR